MRFQSLLLGSIGLVNAEKTWLTRFTAFPPPKTLEVVHFLTASEKDAPEVSINGPVTIKAGANDAELGKGVELSIISHDALSKLSATGTTFCCTENMKNSGACNKVDTLAIDGAYSFPINRETLENGFQGYLYKLPKTGLYYVTLSNCADTSVDANARFGSGELTMVTRYGYLPVLGVWCVWCSSWSDVLFKIHHYISITIIVGALEAGSWYASLYHWNYLGHRWWSMIALASFGTVLKQGVSYGLLLLACLGLGVTRPRLESKQVVQVFILVVAFVISDGVRQMALLLQDRVNGVASTWKIILLVTPGSFFVSVLYVWILQALQDTIQELQSKGQTVKLEVYSQLRFALCLVCGIVVALCGYETLSVRRTELASNWESRYIFTDVLSHSCFFFLLCVIMYLWRPSERSVQMAFSDQLGAEGAGEPGKGIEMTGGEKDFESVDVELGEDPAESGEFDFKKSMEEAKSKGKPVLE